MTAAPLPQTSSRGPRLGGLFLRAARATTRLTLPFAESAGTRSSRSCVTPDAGRAEPSRPPVAARRVADGFIVALAFGSTAHWYRNLVAAHGGVIRWRGLDHAVGSARSDRRRTRARGVPSRPARGPSSGRHRRLRLPAGCACGRRPHDLAGRGQSQRTIRLPDLRDRGEPGVPRQPGRPCLRPIGSAQSCGRSTSASVSGLSSCTCGARTA